MHIKYTFTMYKEKIDRTKRKNRSPIITRDFNTLLSVTNRGMGSVKRNRSGDYGY